MMGGGGEERGEELGPQRKREHIYLFLLELCEFFNLKSQPLDICLPHVYNPSP